MKKTHFTAIFYSISFIIFSQNYEETFEYKDGFILFKELQINQRNLKGNFLFDTGCQTTVLDPSLLKNLQYDIIGKMTSVDIHGNKKIVIKIKLNEVNIGGKSFYNQEAVVQSIKDYQCHDLSAIIGLNWIKNVNWKLKFNSQTFKVFETDFHCKIPNSAILSFSLKKNKIIIPLRTQNKLYQTVLDTGSKNDISLNKMDLKKIIQKNQIKDTLYITTFLSQSLNQIEPTKKQVKFGKIRNMTIGNYNFTGNVVFNYFRLIGMNFFKKSDYLILDFKNEKLVFDKAVFIKKNEPIIKHGIGFEKFKNDDLIVNYIRENSFFGKQGIQVGDKVKAVNKLTCLCLNVCECDEIMKREILKDTLEVEFESGVRLISIK